MATRKMLVGVVAVGVVAAGIASLAGPAYAQKVKISVSAKNAEKTQTAKIKVECPRDCDGRSRENTNSAKGTVECPGGKSTITCASADPDYPGSITFYRSHTTNSECDWDSGVARVKAAPPEVTCIGTHTFPPDDIVFGAGASITGKIENEPVK